MSKDKLDRLALEALDELEAIFYLPERKPEDLDVNDIGEKLGCNDSSVRERMKKLIKQGLWHKVKVRGENGRGLTVYRKGAKPDEKE